MNLAVLEGAHGAGVYMTRPSHFIGSLNGSSCATPTAAPGADQPTSPFLASRASASNCSSILSPGAYFRYHQHQPSLISS